MSLPTGADGEKGHLVKLGYASPAGWSRIVSVGGYRPVRSVGSAEAAQAAGVEAEWIVARVGIEQRGHAGPTETVAAIGAAAARRALASAGVPPSRVDTVIVASSSAESPMPNVAATLAADLGAVAAAAFDLNAACSGFCYALAVADSLIRAGTAVTILVVASERMTDWVDPTDRGTGPIFADGAGAVVMSADSECGVFPVAWGSDGTGAQLISIPDRRGLMRMQGLDVYRWATTELAPVARQACEYAGVKPGDVSAFVPHQANLRIVEKLAAALGLGAVVVARDLARAGNTGAASIPLALAALKEDQAVKTGDLVLLLGYGAGLTYASQVVTCP